MNRDKILTYVRQLASDKEGKLTASSTLITNGLIDSLAVIDLISFLENEFGVKLTNEEMTPENFDSVDAMASLVETKSAGKSTGQKA